MMGHELPAGATIETTRIRGQGGSVLSRLDNDGSLAPVGYLSGASPPAPLDISFGRVVNRYVATVPGCRKASGELGRLFQGCHRHVAVFGANDDMCPRHSLGVEPQVMRCRELEAHCLVLPTVPPNEDDKAVFR